MKNQSISKIQTLLEKGVKIPNPKSVEIGPEVDTDRISGDDVVIHAGCKLYGSSTLILRGTKLGYEGPVTIENCQIGPQVDLMSGGTSRKNHSEVGSSYIHFNYTPNQDKATPSLIGDVPRGVMLNQRPIFLGGQGGLVGPCRLEFGTVIAAGSIFRKDELRPERLLIGNMAKGGSMPFTPGVYYNIKRITVNNIIYIANLVALDHWYTHVRYQFISDDFPEPLFVGLKEKLDMAIDERIYRLKALSRKISDSVTAYQLHAKDKESHLVVQQKNELYQRRTELEENFKSQRYAEENTESRDVFLEKLDLGIKTSGKAYISVIKGLSIEDTKAGTAWLQGIVDHITAGALKIIPSFT
jgi:UDP-N-acetylglucosamine/UDP-N-acetylgalactosamine diphosphorylase